MAAVLLIGYLIFGGDGCENCVVIQDAHNITVEIASEGSDSPLAEIQASAPVDRPKLLRQR
jgi:hypothetical protein